PNSISCTLNRQGPSKACSWPRPLNLRGCVVVCRGSEENEGLLKVQDKAGMEVLAKIHSDHVLRHTYKNISGTQL
ncbi:hypothetical protein ILYODFUR_031142, partial [Ilyodon furcidens]